ncbi:MAG: phosphatidylinositol dimannoside acyltransferase [Actinomycetota bacterium]|nr:phosphatidylinositol dimannoside acyltransferase [Actinomycetota bacterium]
MPRETRPQKEGKLLQLVYYGYVAGSFIARAIPERPAYGLAHFAGGLLARRRTDRRRSVERNLARVTGAAIGSRRLDRSVTEAYRSYARYWLETFRLVRETREFFLERFHVFGEERLDEVLGRGKGAVVVVSHLGNWDAGGAWVGASGRRLVTVAEVLRPRRMFDFFAAHRAKLGMTIFPAEAGVTRKLIASVEDGAIVAIVGDRDLTGRGLQVELFGAPATLPAGPAFVALRAGVPLIVAGIYGVKRADGRRGWEAHIGEIIELPDVDAADAVAQLTKQIAVELEHFIAMRPEEWHVFQPFWPQDRVEA